MNRVLISCIAGLGMFAVSSAHALVIDGNLSDWGVHHNGNSADWTVNSSFAASTVEDQTGNSSTYLNPGWGGQAYDAEAMYVTWSASSLYIGFATGHSPNTPQNPGGNSYGPGDIAIDIGNNGTWDYGIELQGNGGFTQGRVYASPTFAPGVVASNPTSLTGGTGVGSLGSVVYTTTGQNGYGQYTSDNHYFYEIAVPLSAFGGNLGVGTTFKVHWTMNCANDVITVTTTRNTTSKVPLPGTLALLPLGLMGMAALRRRRQS
jgi:hypothetical protein